jgi:small subunit ribosomal protein S1
LSIDSENQRVSLGVKQLTDNPWANIEEQYSVGSIVEGTVSKVTSFGAFVKLASGIEGLVHAKEHQNHNLESELKVGSTVKVRVAKVSKEEQKIALSLNLDAQAAPVQQASQAAQPAQPKRRVEKEEVKQPRKDSAPKSKSMMQLELEKLTGQKDEQ